MALNPFNRDTAYFQSMRDRGMMMNAEDFDFQFNSLADYLNNKIVPLVNTLKAEEIPGTDETDTFLLNVGDGTTKWVKVNSNNIADFTIPLSKLSSFEADLFGGALGSVLATNSGKVFTATEPTAEDQVLASRQNNTPIWRFIETGDILDASIIGSKIAFQSIGVEHLSPLVVSNYIPLNSILNRHILDGNITGEKLEDGSIIARTIALDLLQERTEKIRDSIYSPNFSPALNNYTFLDNSLENRHFADQVIGTQAGNGMWPIMQIRIKTTDREDDNTNYTFTSDNIIDNSITSAVLKPHSPASDPKRIFARGSIQNYHLGEYSVKLNEYAYVDRINKDRGTIRKEKLSAEIRQKLGV
jgi:hypothetical protein